MKPFRYPLHTLLAILQQAEYDLKEFRHWGESFHVLPPEQITALQPERWTPKLKIIAKLARIFSLFLPHRLSVTLSTHLFTPLERFVRGYLLWSARRRLRRLQDNGLTVIAVAGSYGKTSTKHLLQHTLSGWLSTYASPGSYNTLLGLATSIGHLSEHHDVFLAELGEFNPGDIAQLLEFLRPDIAILTPIGFAHLERFGDEGTLIENFAALWNSPHAPDLLLIDDENRGKIQPPDHAKWYGSLTESYLRVKIRENSLEGSTGSLTFSDNTTLPFHLPLPGRSLARNTLPGLLLLQFFEQPMDIGVQALQFVQPIPRRLEVTINPNGSRFVDNSYNTNPGAWEHSLTLLQSLPPEKTVLLTAGFVELDTATNHSEHVALARQLLDLNVMLGVVRTRYNQALLDELTKHLPPERLLVGLSYDELIAQLTQLNRRWDTIWIEGGVRELYQ